MFRLKAQRNPPPTEHAAEEGLGPRQVHLHEWNRFFFLDQDNQTFFSCSLIMLTVLSLNDHENICAIVFLSHDEQIKFPEPREFLKVNLDVCVCFFFFFLLF